MFHHAHDETYGQDPELVEFALGQNSKIVNIVPAATERVRIRPLPLPILCADTPASSVTSSSSSSTAPFSILSTPCSAASSRTAVAPLPITAPVTPTRPPKRKREVSVERPAREPEIRNRTSMGESRKEVRNQERTKAFQSYCEYIRGRRDDFARVFEEAIRSVPQLAPFVKTMRAAALNYFPAVPEILKPGDDYRTHMQSATKIMSGTEYAFLAVFMTLPIFGQCWTPYMFNCTVKMPAGAQAKFSTSGISRMDESWKYMYKVNKRLAFSEEDHYRLVVSHLCEITEPANREMWPSFHRKEMWRYPPYRKAEPVLCEWSNIQRAAVRMAAVLREAGWPMFEPLAPAETSGAQKQFSKILRPVWMTALLIVRWLLFQRMLCMWGPSFERKYTISVDFINLFNADVERNYVHMLKPSALKSKFVVLKAFIKQRRLFHAQQSSANLSPSNDTGDASGIHPRGPQTPPTSTSSSWASVSSSKTGEGAIMGGGGVGDEDVSDAVSPEDISRVLLQQSQQDSH